jgi:D-glycero-alpha-D-manno-heptose-7-phosphate kinase
VIVASCPLRISLVGGSTDHPRFIEKYKRGSVISFASNLRTYVTIHKDTFGANAIDEKFVLNYSKRESVQTVQEIQNELIRYCLEYFNITEHFNCTLTSDVFSAGSGLASSSSYLQSLIKAICVMRKQSITHAEICRFAELIERKFNPLVGQQDFYGSIGGLKRIDFYETALPQIRFLNNQLFNQMNCYLIYTGILRSSTEILENINIDKSIPLLKDVDDLEHAIEVNDNELFHTIINRSWENKKKTSPQICNHPDLIKLDSKLYDDENVFSHKLCGAGNGGFFLVFTKQNTDDHFSQEYSNIKQISISEIGVDAINFKHEFTKL